MKNNHKLNNSLLRSQQGIGMTCIVDPLDLISSTDSSCSPECRHENNRRRNERSPRARLPTTPLQASN